MGLAPKIKKKTLFKTCEICGGTYGCDCFAPTKSIFYPDGYIPICNNCIDKWLEENKWEWDKVDKLCQMMDIPFIPKEWEQIKEMAPNGAFGRYATICLNHEYYGVGWGSFYKKYLTLKSNNSLSEEIPLVGEEERRQLRSKWGSNYDDEELDYLERLYKGILVSQSVNGAMQEDRALKICKLSLKIDSKLRAGEDIDKDLSAYDKLVKQAEFTPTNIKNLNDFDSIGELIKWCERKGWRARYHDGTSRDIVDETMSNMQAFNQRLYTNESGIGEQITERIQALNNVKQFEDDFGGVNESDLALDDYENEGFKGLKDEEFDVSMDGDEDGAD